MASNPMRVDRRVARTRKAIMEAFNSLVIERGIDKITVSAIAREADIDRKTFYLHYSSVNDLANRKTEEDLETVLHAFKERSVGKSAVERIHILLVEVNSLVKQNFDVYQHMASSLSTDQLLDRIEQALMPAIEHEGIEVGAPIDQGVQMRLHFYIAGALSLYASWLKSDHASPIEVVSSTIENAVKLSVMPTLSIA